MQKPKKTAAKTNSDLDREFQRAMTAEKTARAKTRKPLVISIHGEGLDIEANFNEAPLSKVLANAIARVNGTVAHEAPAAPVTSLAALMAKLGTLLRKDQVAGLQAMFDAEQTQLFMEITTHIDVLRAVEAATRGKPGRRKPPKPKHNHVS